MGRVGMSFVQARAVVMCPGRGFGPDYREPSSLRARLAAWVVGSPGVVWKYRNFGLWQGLGAEITDIRGT